MLKYKLHKDRSTCDRSCYTCEYLDIPELKLSGEKAIMRTSVQTKAIRELSTTMAKCQIDDIKRLFKWYFEESKKEETNHDNTRTI